MANAGSGSITASYVSGASRPARTMSPSASTRSAIFGSNCLPRRSRESLAECAESDETEAELRPGDLERGHANDPETSDEKPPIRLQVLARMLIEVEDDHLGCLFVRLGETRLGACDQGLPAISANSSGVDYCLGRHHQPKEESCVQR